jgi:hypothetical protein
MMQRRGGSPKGLFPLSFSTHQSSFYGRQKGGHFFSESRRLQAPISCRNCTIPVDQTVRFVYKNTHAILLVQTPSIAPMVP